MASLKLKKQRQDLGLFVVEGEKSVSDALEANWQCERLIINADWYARHSLPALFGAHQHQEATLEQMERMTHLSSASPVLGVFKQQELPWEWQADHSGFLIALDGIRDPGNLGTIIRIADWFDFAGVLCSNDTVELWNNKTIQASMGSIFRVPVKYTELTEALNDIPAERLYAAVLGGKELNSIEFVEGAILLIGSESFGLSEALKTRASQHISIPAFGKAESLNAAVAAGIICARMRS